MILVRFDEVSLEFGDQAILHEASMSIETGERVCLIGRNGAGKTTLLKLITGQLQQDSGEIQYKNDIVISQLEQVMPEDTGQTVYEMVASGLASVLTLRNQYESLSGQEPNREILRELESLQQRIDALDGWHIEQRVDTIITELNLPEERRVSELSGGWQRRVALAKALISKPDLLLLDEPTNHLDIVAIQWLEDNIYAYPGSVLFITHDRAFLQRLATRILELDRTRLVSWPGNYRNFQRRKEKALEDEQTANKLFDKKLSEEEIWIRQGIKARRTRNEGRVRTLQAMREERAARPAMSGKARISIDRAEQSGRKVIRAYNLTHGYGGETLFSNISLKVMRGDRIALIGNNGVGKSTLLRILLGKIEPQQGTVKHGMGLEIGYFDQMREQLDMTKSIADNVGDGSDYIRINGKQQHIVGYLKGFLFSPKRSLTPVKSLSGGERNRVILAKLFTRPTNLLVLDEPTNDLDVETMEVLEKRLVEYDGTLIVVSHDREFVDNVVTSTLVFESDRQITEYIGGYSDWLRRGQQLAEVDRPVNMGSQAGSGGTVVSKGRRKSRKLSFKQAYELEHLPKNIETLEAEIRSLDQEVAAEGFYKRSHAETEGVLKELDGKSSELERATERYFELEGQREQFKAEKRKT